MLLNKGEEITIKYNGYEKTVAKGQKVDVRDFDISVGQTSPLKELVTKVENRIVRKYAGQFEVVEDDGSNVKDESIAEIAELKKKIAELTRSLNEQIKINDESAKKISTLAGEINEFGAKEASYKAEIDKLKKEAKDSEEEHEAHISRIMGGKKGK